ncbi:MAG: PD-(D/E)XK nuclease family protein [Myxococcota bacterium]|nr:PD-(D/E)XK nuclease family protein [Myxococcota bacterium]
MPLTPGSIIDVRSPAVFERWLIASLRSFGSANGIRRIVVPSESLRQHWVRRIAGACRATVGVEVCTHKRFARTIVHDQEIPTADRDQWADELVREFSADEPALWRALGELDDGFGLVAKQVRELLDAGLTAAHEAAMLEAVGHLPGRGGIGAGVPPRIAALVRVACRVQQATKGVGVCTGPLLFSRARELVEAEPSVRAGIEGTAFVGFADATGRLADLIKAAQTHAGAVVVLDSPPNPSTPSRVDPGREFAAAYRSRFDAADAVECGTLSAPVHLVHVGASDPYAEARDVAERVQALIADGVPAEDIGVVVRMLEPWVHPLGEAFRERGVPFSGVDSSRPGGGVFRRANAVARVLSDGAAAPASAWLEACGWTGGGLDQMAIDSVGARTIDEAAVKCRGVIRSSAIRGLVPGEASPRVASVMIDAERMKRLRRSAEELRDALEGWAGSHTPEVHRKHLRDLLVKRLRVDASSPIVDTALRTVSQVPTGCQIDQRGVARMFCQAVRSVGRSKIGGAGGGVAVLTATEARGRSFHSVFLMGLVRGEFPRAVQEDSLFPDAARRALQVVLPDLRLRMDGLLEERFLFAQLVNSAPAVVLTSSRIAADGKRLHPSPFLNELMLAGALDPVPEPILEVTPTAWREAVNRGLQGAEAGEVIGTAVQGGLAPMAGVGVPLPAPEVNFGHVGPVVHSLDPRNRPVYVTMVEQLARCPWSAFLQRMLGIRDRVGAGTDLPSVSNHLIGLTVHATVDRVVQHTVGGAVLAEPSAMDWPDEPTLRAWVEDAAREALRQQGAGWIGFARAVVPPAMVALGLLRTMDTELDGILGGEVDLVWNAPNGRALSFRADRIEAQAGETLVTDIKLGRPPTEHKTESSRRKKIVEAVRRGELLQGPLYARSESADRGRYVYLNPTSELPVREFVFHADDDEVIGAMDRILEEVNAVVETGAMFPRVSEADRDKKPTACSHCRVREVCAVEDSTARRAVMNRVGGRENDAAHRAERALWHRGSE